MNPVRKWIRDIFGFSGNEINGFMILIPLMILLIFSEPAYHSWVASEQRQYPDDVRKLDSLLTPAANSPGAANKTPVTYEVGSFGFDPNKASTETLRKLGFSEILATRIAAYRSKGGVFRVKSDLLKIYGLDSTLYKRLYLFIKLPSRPLYQDQQVPAAKGSGKQSVSKPFDINTADTILLKKVYGIGSVLAARIIKFRDALGGFVKPEQLNEVYGLDSVVVKRLLKVGFVKADFVPEKLNINTADEEKLSGHPYIRRKLAGALVSYRFQHGDFKDITDIKKLSIMRPDEMERLLPYLKTVDE
ncbi:MAG: helix-hairpin-helix domain-containing protein [Chryseosolibacter sp.]